MDKKENISKSNKIDLLPRDGNGFVDLDLVEDDSDYSDLPEAKILDPDLYKLVSKPRLVEPSDAVEQRVMQFYRKELYYTRIWWNLRAKLREWKGFLPLNMELGMKVALASAVLLFLVTAVYLQYKFFNNVKENNPIVNKETPKINPSPTPSAIPIPEITSTPTPNIAKENNKPSNDNKLNTTNNKSNDEQHNLANDKQNNGLKKIKDRNLDKNNKNSPKDDELENKIATNNSNSKNNVTIGEVSNTSRTLTTKDIILSEVKTIYVADFGDQEQDKELRKAVINKFNNSGQFKLLKPTDMVKSKADGVLRKKDGFIRLASGVSDKTLWERSIGNITKASPEETAEQIFNQLLEEIKK